MPMGGSSPCFPKLPILLNAFVWQAVNIDNINPHVRFATNVVPSVPLQIVHGSHNAFVVGAPAGRLPGCTYR